MKLSDLGTSFSIEINKRIKEVSELALFFSVLLLFGTFLVGIAQFLIENQVTIEGIKLLSYRADYLSTLIYSGSAIIGGCLVGLLGLLLYILLYKTGLRDYIINGFLIDAILSILFGTLYFIINMTSNQMWLLIIISATLIVATIGILLSFLKQRKNIEFN